ncbi:unnamed protein product [Colias eurytheme]|nr:unnamed protein product [Colias eurytheme]
MFEDEDEDAFESLYENGHWIWNEEVEKLQFISDLPVMIEDDYELPSTALTNVEFKDDVDLLEQQRFRKYLQRKTEDDDVVTLQDLKDVVLFTAPTSILSPALINLLHLSTTERFLRALILYVQYFLQISDEMSHRTLELETKIRTQNSDKIELKYQEDLEDLRLLVAKEYCIIILGKDALAPYHHMGVDKRQSLSKKDSILYETLLRISIQIVWIALGRKCYNYIELEINRILKTEIFNTAEHKLKTNYFNNIIPRERRVLLGHCLNQGQKLNTTSPLINEVFCNRQMDFRHLGLGVVKYSGLSQRLIILELFLCAPETKFKKLDLSLGILGILRSRFDIMLHEIKAAPTNASSSFSTSRSTAHRASRSSRKSTVSAAPEKLIPDLYIPEKTETQQYIYDSFPAQGKAQLVCSNKQRLKWLKYIASRRKNKLASKNIVQNKYK